MFFFNKLPSISPSEAQQKLSQDGAVLLDVRSPQEFMSGHARGAINCPLPSLRTCFNKLRRASEVYVICQSGGRSATATSALLAEGIHATNVTGGTLAWRAKGLPLD